MAEPTTVQPSVKLKALQNLSNQMPAANQKIATQRKAAQDIQLQNAVAQAPTTAPVQQTAQQLGGAMAQNAGAEMINTAKQNIQGQGQIANTGLAVEGQAQEAKLASQKLGLKEEQMDMAERFARLDARAKQELYDKQIQFQKDEAGRNLMNERQILDYARASGVADEQLKNYEQYATQAANRELQALQQANKVIIQNLELEYQQAKQGGDQDTQIKIAQQIAAQKQAMAEEEKNAANKSARGGAIGTIAGATAGAVIGGSAGAMVGGQIGGGLGTAVASRT